MAKVDPNLRERLLDIKERMADEKYQVKTSKQVIVFGMIGSGKTTLSCIMTGKNVKVVINKKPVLQYEGICSWNESGTEIPGIMIDESNDISFVDMPSFEDRYLQEIKDTFSIYNLLYSKKKEANTKILILISCYDFERFYINVVHDFFARVDSMLSHLTESEKEAVGLVITKEEKGFPANYYIDSLNCEGSNQITKKWCEYFINHPEQLFLIPAATRSMANETFYFDDKNRLKEFLLKGQFINPNLNLTLGEDSRFCLGNCFLRHKCDLFDEVDEIVKSITDIYKQITKGEDLNKWSNKIQNISQMKINNPRVLLDLIQNNFSDNKNKFDRSIEKLEGLDALHSFFIDVLKIKDQYIIDEIEVPIDNKITRLISEFNTYKYFKIQQEEAEKINK